MIAPCRKLRWPSGGKRRAPFLRRGVVHCFAALPAMALLFFSASLSAAELVAVGLLEPRLRVVFSSEYPMMVRRVHPRVGDSFAPGEALVEFDATLARIGLEAATAEESFAAAHHRSMRELAEANQVTAIELEMAHRDLVLAEAKRRAAEREIAQAVLRAGFAGRVAERHIQDYEWAARGAPLLTVVDDATLEVRFILPETYFPLVKVGAPLRVTVPAVSGDSAATVSRVGAVFDSASRTFDVWAEIDNSAGHYRAGMTAGVDLSGLAAAGGPP